MRYIPMNKKAKEQAVRMHRKCWRIDQRMLKQKKGTVEIVKGKMIYRA